MWNFTPMDMAALMLAGDSPLAIVVALVAVAAGWVAWRRLRMQPAPSSTHRPVPPQRPAPPKPNQPPPPEQARLRKQVKGDVLVAARALREAHASAGDPDALARALSELKLMLTALSTGGHQGRIALTEYCNAVRPSPPPHAMHRTITARSHARSSSTATRSTS